MCIRDRLESANWDNFYIVVCNCDHSDYNQVLNVENLLFVTAVCEGESVSKCRPTATRHWLMGKKGY